MNGFNIIKKIGNGTFSVVYKVLRKADNTIYALKKVKLPKLKDKEKQSALNEVRILASISSPFIISYKEAFIEESDKSLCIVMEYADDGDLYQKITQYKKMNLSMEESDIWRVFIQIVKGLKVLHDLKILHRDLKSANILLFNDGSAKIGDCNVSKIFYGDKNLGYTQTGTPYYASPEVKAGTMDALYKKIIRGQYGKISKKYSGDIADIVNNLIKVDPNDRLSCDEILKNESVMERIDFFKDREGFNDDDLNNKEDNILMKSFRLTKNMRFISEQLPNPNYNSPKNVNNIKINKNIKNTSLPNIIKSHQFNAGNSIKNDIKIGTPKKNTFMKYKLINRKNLTNLTKREYSNENKTQKNLLMETENVILSYTKNNYKRIFHNEVEKSNNNNDSINLSQKNIIRLNTKSLNKTNNKNSKSKYKKELSLMNIYPEYERGTKRNNRFNNNDNKNNYYLPNIYQNKIKSSYRRTRVKSKK